MKVAAYGPQTWFLFQEGNDYFLSVRCQQSFAEFELMVRLAPEEYREYHALGTVYLDYLAARVSYWAREYHSRDESTKYRAATSQAVAEWKQTHSV